MPELPPAGGPHGLCPACLLGAMMAEDDVCTEEPPADATAWVRAVPARVSAPSEAAGERIGRYKLLQQIGEGGFGTVWMAEQMEPVLRRAALKIIKLAWTRSRSSPALKPNARPWR